MDAGVVGVCVVGLGIALAVLAVAVAGPRRPDPEWVEVTPEREP